MADKVGDVFDGYITGVAPFGMFVELIDHYVEGLVHVSTMADDYYRYREQQHTLFGESTRKTYRLGDRVRVQIVRVDMERRQIDLGLHDVLEKVRRDERSRGPSRSGARVKKDQRKGPPAFAKASAGQAGQRKRKQRLGKKERGSRRR
jgi:ribonuclease R